MTNSTLYLVGAGPGDIGLVTLRAMELIKKADCIIYDGLVNPALLEYAPAETELIRVGKRIGKNPVTQEQINEIILAKAKQYKIILRLKGGDPCMFGMAAQEVELCTQARIPFEIVPGITAAMAAACYSGIFLTDRSHSSQVTFATGHESPGKAQSSLDFENLAKSRGTLVFYMGIGNLEKIVLNLIACGKNAQTPAAVVENATRQNQRIVQTTLSMLREKCESEKIKPPAIIIIGESAANPDSYNWFMNKPLFGKKIAITRDAAGNNVLENKLRKFGAEIIRYNSIEIIDKCQNDLAQEILGRINDFNWMIFTSANAIRFVFSALSKLKKDARVFCASRIACIGSESAKCLETYGLTADFVPTKYTSSDLVDQLSGEYDLIGKSILLLRSKIAPDVLPKSLNSLGALVSDIDAYNVVASNEESGHLEESLLRSELDWITFTSASCVTSVVNSVGVDVMKKNSAKIASIGPITSLRLKEFGICADIEAKEHTIDGLVEVISKF